MALLVARVAFDAYEIVLRDKPAAMVSASPKGTVPVLVLSDGRVLEQSWDIVEWALTQEGAGAGAQDCWSRTQTLENQLLLCCNDGDFKYHLDCYKYPERFAAEAGPAVAADRTGVHRDEGVAALLEPLELRLADGGFLGGVQPCAADLGIFPFVRQFAAVDPVWFGALPLRNTKAWLEFWLQWPLFEA